MAPKPWKTCMTQTSMANHGLGPHATFVGKSAPRFCFVAGQPLQFVRIENKFKGAEMFGKLSTGWRLAKQSLEVLKLDKELLLFPIFSGLACIVAMASFAVPIFASGLHEGLLEEEVGSGTQILMGILGFLFYFVTYFIIIFFNSALVGCAIIRLKGGDPTVRDGFGAAMARLPQIASWALVAATVGFILKIIESRSEKVGAIVSGLLGMAWSITTFFVIPVLVVEKTGPIDAVKRSVAVIKKTWGESLGANMGIGFITFLASLVALLPIGGGIAAMSVSPVLGGILIGLGVLWILFVSLVSSALGSILLAALYIYAAEGKMPQHYDPNMIKGAFATK